MCFPLRLYKYLCDQMCAHMCMRKRERERERERGKGGEGKKDQERKRKRWGERYTNRQNSFLAKIVLKIALVCSFFLSTVLFEVATNVA